MVVSMDAGGGLRARGAEAGVASTSTEDWAVSSFCSAAEIAIETGASPVSGALGDSTDFGSARAANESGLAASKPQVGHWCVRDARAILCRSIGAASSDPTAPCAWKEKLV